MILAKSIFNGYKYGPVISEKHYEHEKQFRDPSTFHKPKNFQEIFSSLTSRSKPLLLSGFGKGTDYVAVKLLQKAANLQPDNRIFEIKIYTKETINDFVNDFNTDKMHGVSVILRDIFDPFQQNYHSDGNRDYLKHRYCELVDKIEKPESKFKIENPIISDELLHDRSLENFFQSTFDQIDRIFKFFDHQRGNFLIFTTQFDSHIKLKNFYQFYYGTEGSAAYDKLVNVTGRLFHHSVDYDDKLFERYFSDIMEDLTDIAEKDIKWIEKDLEKLYREFVFKEEHFRIGFGMSFRNYATADLKKFKTESGLEDSVLKDFLEQITRKLSLINQYMSNYFKFLHEEHESRIGS